MDDSNGSIAKWVTITEDLFQPVNFVIHDDFIYVSNNTFNMGIEDCKGQILSQSQTLLVGSFLLGARCTMIYDDN